MPSFLNGQGDYFLEHPSYSPYISPCDFFVFLRLKKILLVENIPTANSQVPPHLTCLEVYPKKTMRKPSKIRFKD